MDVIYPRFTGLDVDKQTIAGCARLSSDGAPRPEVRTSATTTAGPLTLADWVASLSVRHVAMEATGAHSKPKWHVLDRADAIKTPDRLIHRLQQIGY